MPRRRQVSRPTTVAAVLGMAALTAGCACDSARAVVDVVPASLSHSMEVVATSGVADVTSGEELVYSDERPEEAVQAGAAGGDPEENSSALTLRAPGTGGVDLRSTLGSGVTQLDPELGPMDLGWPLLIDLGAGEAPYDDGVRTIHVVERTRSGFSDAVLQASWRESVTPASMLHATVALTRYQDLGMLDGADQMRFAWLVLGWKVYL